MRVVLLMATLAVVGGCDDTEFTTGGGGGGSSTYYPDHIGAIALMRDHCEECHVEGGIWPQFTLELLEEDIREGNQEWVVPGDRNASELWARLSDNGEFPVMPQTGALPLDTVEPIGVWIDEGAVLYNEEGAQ